MQDELDASVVGRHGDGHGRRGVGRDRGRVGSVVEAETGNSANVADR